MVDRPLLTVFEAADYLRTPTLTLRYWRHLGTGPRWFKLGNRVVYRAAALEVWLAELEDRARGDRNERGCTCICVCLLTVRGGGWQVGNPPPAWGASVIGGAPRNRGGPKA